jgi:hypothetical protein
MIDTTAIILSLGMVVYIIWRAAVLDRQLPWFGVDRKTEREQPRARARR